MLIHSGGWAGIRKDYMYTKPRNLEEFNNENKVMTKETIIRMLKAKHECISRQCRGNYKECNNTLCDSCDLCYEQGTYGDQKLMIETLLWALDCGVIG